MSYRLKKSTCLFFVLWLIFTLSACTEARQPELDAVVRATLDNGLRVVIVPNNLAPVVTAVMNYLVGSNEAPRDFLSRRMPWNHNNQDILL